MTAVNPKVFLKEDASPELNLQYIVKYHAVTTAYCALSARIYARVSRYFRNSIAVSITFIAVLIFSLYLSLNIVALPAGVVATFWIHRSVKNYKARSWHETRLMAYRLEVEKLLKGISPVIVTYRQHKELSMIAQYQAHKAEFQKIPSNITARDWIRHNLIAIANKFDEKHKERKELVVQFQEKLKRFPNIKGDLRKLLDTSCAFFLEENSKYLSINQLAGTSGNAVEDFEVSNSVKWL